MEPILTLSCNPQNIKMRELKNLKMIIHLFSLANVFMVKLKAVALVISKINLKTWFMVKF